ncbi:MAG: DUF6384 family protein [Rhodomicrobium sp.]|jgi:Family of unknown function (DUF6384)
MPQSAVAASGEPPAPAKLDDLMIAMDVVDTLRHRDRLIERELNEEVREEQLVEQLRALYKSQGLDVPDSVIAEGVKALRESRFVYKPPEPGMERWLAHLWVKRASIGRWLGGSLAILALAAAIYQFSVVRPQREKAEAARIELTESLPRELGAAHKAILAGAQVPAARQKADALLAEGRAALERGDASRAREAVASLDELANTLRQEFTLRIAGRPGDQTGFFRENRGYQGRAYFVVVDAVDSKGNPVKIPVRNDETNQTETVSRFAVRVPPETFEAIRQDKSKNGIVQNPRLAEKRRGFVDPDFLMPVLEGRISRW